MKSFAWTEFYTDFANQLLAWQNKRPALFELIRDIARRNPLLDYLHFEHEAMWSERGNEIDPFTVMGIFNRATTDTHRHDLGLALARALGLKNMQVPEVFHGIPHLDPRRSIYAGNEEMWNLFLAACHTTGVETNQFISAWDTAIKVKGNALATLSIALFWARPFNFMPVDKMSAPWVKYNFGLEEPASKCSGLEYEDYCMAVEKRLEKEIPKGSFPALALAAWHSMQEK